MAIATYPAYKQADILIAISETSFFAADAEISIRQIISPNSLIISWQLIQDISTNKFFAYVMYVINVDTSPQKVEVINNSKRI